ncbi:metallophosphoesterase family protein [Cytophagaceae bacterium 50C-KIRBA]|uniref:Metallophosphoesterase family protein n=1 Tax=Aquirufa beregesia TaxID=2516556 RepID=A0ABX0EVG4_9BACT|nr:metallophosphoesterase family protein [Aquirufa beregesia]NGZ44559.1 metallophosphoesterase family protein [Aquirufa beregesia]
MKHLIILLMLGVIPAWAQNAKIVRGPYLQNFTSTSGVIRWRTDVPTDSRVYYGKALPKNTQSVYDAHLTTEHEIKITRLIPNQTYFYSIASPQVLAHQFVKTLPKLGSNQAIRIWALGDFGTGSKNQLLVRDAVKNFVKQKPIDAWIWLGDNAYGSGKDVEYQKNVFEVYQDDFFSNTKLWPNPGNHDYKDNPDSKKLAYYQNFTMPMNGEAGGLKSGTEAYYSFNLGNVHFVSVNSEETSEDGTSIIDSTGQQAQWLKRDLAANKLPWTIVYFHEPPYSKGSHDTDTDEEMTKVRQQIVPIFDRYRVDLVLAGHSHSYERTKPIRGHLGQNDSFEAHKHVLAKEIKPNHYVVDKSSAQGTIYIVAGSGGQLGKSQASFPLKSSAFSTVALGGSLILDVEGKRLVGQWLGSDGKVHDEFSIHK